MKSGEPKKSSEGKRGHVNKCAGHRSAADRLDRGTSSRVTE